MSKIKLVCFDLDDTLIRKIHSVMLPCILNGKEKEHSVIQSKEEDGLLNYIDADHERAKLLENLEEIKISVHFLDVAKPLKNIGPVVKKLHEHNIKCIVITVGPKQVAKVVHDIWDFDDFYGSDYEVINGRFTGRIIDYISADDKITCLNDYCKRENILPEECFAVGDGSTDIPVFEHCGKSLALNSMDSVKDKATYSLDTDDLSEILDLIIL